MLYTTSNRLQCSREILFLDRDPILFIYNSIYRYPEDMSDKYMSLRDLYIDLPVRPEGAETRDPASRNCGSPLWECTRRRAKGGSRGCPRERRRRAAPPPAMSEAPPQPSHPSQRAVVPLFVQAFKALGARNPTRQAIPWLCTRQEREKVGTPPASLCPPCPPQTGGRPGRSERGPRSVPCRDTASDFSSLFARACVAFPQYDTAAEQKLRGCIEGTRAGAQPGVHVRLKLSPTAPWTAARSRWVIRVSA